MLAFFGFLSSLTFILAELPYIRDVLRGTTHPHRTTWILAGSINSINVFNQMAAGATTSLPFFVVVAVATSTIAILSIWRGTGGLSKGDILCALIAVSGLILWAIFRTPTVSIVANIVAATAALIPTMIKSYKAPHTETHITWLLGTISTIFSALSVGSLNIQLLALPLHGVLLQGIIFGILALRTRSLADAKSTPPDAVPTI